MPHGFRSSFRDWAAQKTDHPREAIEAALAHVVQNKVEAANARSDLLEALTPADGRLVGVFTKSVNSAEGAEARRAKC